jgi:hypothetical protein
MEKYVFFALLANINSIIPKLFNSEVEIRLLF